MSGSRPLPRRPVRQDLPQWDDHPSAQSHHNFQNFETPLSNKYDRGRPPTPTPSPRSQRHSGEDYHYNQSNLSNYQTNITPPSSSPPSAPLMPARPAPPVTPALTPTLVQKTRVATGNEVREWEDLLGGTVLQDNKESRFLDAIDAIREHALDCQLDIPELVVCGSQSSGKSSVLEAITRVPFPRGDTTCTRFVTQIKLIRGPESSVSVSILPDATRSPADKAVLKQFAAIGGPNDMTTMINEAGRAMGLKDGHDAWSSDILSVEVRGPTLQRLTLVDLPGLIDVDKQGRSGDARMVETITDNYIKKPQSIILAVVNANDNIQKHRILEKAKTVDPTGKRTFGIITKPDMVEASLDNENQWFKLMDGKSEFFVFQKGWHVLVNRNGQETKDDTSPDARDTKEEAFFKDEIWGSKSGYYGNVGKPNRWHSLYPGKNWGVKQLRPRLRTLLFKHTQEQIPHLKKIIKQKLTAYEDEMAVLDKGLLSKEDLKKLLLDISSDMDNIADHGAKGTYRKHEFFQITEHDTGRYLRAKIRDESERFAQDLKRNGHRTDYAWGPDESPPEGDEWISKVDDVLKRIKGSELPGYHDPHGLDLLFIHYSSPWKLLADEFVGKAYDHSRIFLREVLRDRLERDLPNLSPRVWDHVIEERLEKCRQRAVEELGHLEKDRFELVITESEWFLMKSSERFAERLAQRVRAAEGLGQFPPQDPAMTALSLGLGTPGELRRQQAIKFIDDMLTYYSLARDRYIDNVVAQVVERHLLSRLRMVFRPDWILDEELFATIAHDPDYERRRQQRAAAESRRRNLRSCLTSLDDLERLD